MRLFQTVVKSLPSNHSKPAFESPPVGRRGGIRIVRQQGRVPFWILQELLKTNFKVWTRHPCYLLIPTMHTHSPGIVLEPVASSSSALPTSELEADMFGIGFLPSTLGVLLNPPQTTSPMAVQPTARNSASNTTAGDGGDSFISLLSPSSGTTSGGEQIVLVVDRLPPTKLFARFGDNIVSTVRYNNLKSPNAA
jgi:hypothetical protein